jgi:glycosyltransferase involved in cell wall biosynthesis
MLHDEDAGAAPAAAPRRLRIAMIGHKGIPASHGGIERHVDEIARRLAARGHAVDSFNRPYHPFAASTWEGVRVRRRPSVPTKHLDAGTHTALCVAESIVSRRYDLVHVHGIGPGLFVGWASRFVPTVFTFHAQDWRQRKWGRVARWALRRGESVAVRRAHAVITVSRLLQGYVRDTYGRAALFIPNGACLQARPGSEALRRWGLESGRYLLFVGRLISDRGLRELLQAWAGIADERRLVIVGDVQHDREQVEDLRRRADARVIFTGYQSGAALQQLYAHAYLCVHPSEVEGLPIAVLEAMSHGRAVLVSDIPENLEAVGEAGASFPVGDARALRAALERLLGAPAEVEALGVRARERVARHFDWDRIALDTEAVYRSILR